MTPAPERAIVMFDGVCSFCNAMVRFIAANDPAGTFAFLPLDSPRARALIAAAPPAAAPFAPGDSDTVVLHAHGRSYVMSDAALHVALGLRAPWPLLCALILVPRDVRDAAYRWVARNRYRWCGRYDTCPLPPPGLRERFLDPSAS
jgi:predicted DCC family thiol-disulfide oxidoreductase YuxK